MAKIVAVVTSKPEKVGGGLPVFHAEDQKEAEGLAHLMEKILDAAAHRLEDHLYILVDRH
ncbi:hypothetical protein [Cohnella sp. AR92]|uniref:capping complex subunit for YIEGIA n=1 Tax=Cohnella sp. AR92 TaxID=648716 RepID=UPI000F8DDFB6|nr:hypothetical protein [Cohnella sp. AR92]RUS48156.1 hypothetical protein ELR57_06385 [Cohnella sp. AR92]